MVSDRTLMIIDDDPDSISWLEFVLRERFPELDIQSKTEPDPNGNFDIFLIDNDFHGRCLAGSLAAAIRKQNPHSLIVAFSACLDAATLKHLINEGCDGACDKSSPDDLRQLVHIVERFLNENLPERGPKTKATGFFSAMQSISELLREWNARIENGPVVPSN